MTGATSQIPGLEDIIRNGEPKRREEALHRIAGLFFEDAATLRPRHVDFLDALLTDLIPHAELIARAELAARLSLFANAPRNLVGRLARENDILVAGPLLRRSPVRAGLARNRARQRAETSPGNIGTRCALARSYRYHDASR
jgi:uncharacterized protein (DUF2336 family)